MKKTISIQRSTFHISWRRMIFAFVILSFVFPPILHAEIQNGSIELDGRTRNYMVYLPNNYTGSINFPLVIHLHSGGWTAQQDMNYIKLNQVAEASGFIVAYPSAINKRWNIDSVPGSNINDVGFIDALIDTLNNRYSIDLERIYACGYSRGGFLAYTLAFQLSHRIAAIASVGGGISSFIADSYNPVRPMPILHIHGTRDTWVSINGGSAFLSADQALSIWTNYNSCVQTEITTLPDLDSTDGCTVEKTTYTNGSDNCDIVYYKVIDGGHTWPGAGPPGYAAGSTNQDFNASEEIWNFFKNYKLITQPVVDFNGDDIVDIKDLLRLIQSWGQDESSVDIVIDGIIDAQDLEVLMSFWQQEIFPQELIAYWKLDEEEGDIAYNSISDNYGILIGEPTWRPDSGQISGALELDGVDDCIVTDVVLNPADGPFSIFAWIKGGGPGQVVVSQQNAANWLLTDAGGNLITELRGSNRSSGPLLSQTVITDGQWHRIGLVFDGLNRTLYVDGIIAAEDTQPDLVSSQMGLYIGTGMAMDPETCFSGLIDDVRIYNRVVNP